MPQIQLSETVAYSPRQMYDLVVDMERYPEFLPWCVAGRRLRDEGHQFVAEMTVAFKGVREVFQTLDRVVPGERVDIQLVRGPFSHLRSEWSFTPVAGGTRVDFFIDFQFKSFLLNMTVGPLFAHAARQIVQAFSDRAHARYGDAAEARRRWASG